MKFKDISATRCLTITLLLPVIFNGCTPARPTGPLKPERVIGAYASWRQKEVPPEVLPWSRLTHVGYAFALPRPDGSIDLSHAAGMKEVVREARKHGVKVLLAIGGANGSAPFHVIAAQPTLRKRFTGSVLKVIQDYNLDGVDIDWEHWAGGDPDPKGRQGLLDLLTTLYASLQPAGKILTADVFAGDWYGKHYDAKIVDQVDWLHIMAYDGSGSWSEKPEPHSSYKMIKTALAYWVDKIGNDKRHKLVLNLPFYGKKFPAGFVTGQEVGSIDYREILAAHPQGMEQDKVRGPNYTVFYDGRTTVRKKVQLAIDSGLAGIGIWELTQDSTDPERSLISVFAPRQ